jgi:hypothetical protein
MVPIFSHFADMGGGNPLLNFFKGQEIIHSALRKNGGRFGNKYKLTPEERARCSKLCKHCQEFFEALQGALPKRSELLHSRRMLRQTLVDLEASISEGCHLCRLISRLFPSKLDTYTRRVWGIHSANSAYGYFEPTGLMVWGSPEQCLKHGVKQDTTSPARDIRRRLTTIPHEKKILTWQVCFQINSPNILCRYLWYPKLPAKLDLQEHKLEPTFWTYT